MLIEFGRLVYFYLILIWTWFHARMRKEQDNDNDTFLSMVFLLLIMILEPFLIPIEFSSFVIMWNALLLTTNRIMCEPNENVWLRIVWDSTQFIKFGVLTYGVISYH